MVRIDSCLNFVQGFGYWVGISTALDMTTFRLTLFVDLQVHTSQVPLQFVSLFSILIFKHFSDVFVVVVDDATDAFVF